MTQRQKKVRIKPEINITPLTDIFLVLLIVMMVVAPMLDTKGLAATLLTSSESAETEEEQESKVLVVRITPQGAYQIGDDAVDRDDLAQLLSANLPEHPDGLQVMVDPEAELDLFTFLFDSAKALGIQEISVLEAEPPADN